MGVRLSTLPQTYSPVYFVLLPARVHIAVIVAPLPHIPLWLLFFPLELPRPAASAPSLMNALSRLLAPPFKPI